MSTYKNYLSLKKYFKEIYPDIIVSIKMYNSPIKHLYLHKISVPDEYKNKGIGTKIMQTICDFCDKEKLVCMLEPTSVFGSNLERLIHFYNRFGFIFSNKSENDEMIRNSI